MILKLKTDCDKWSYIGEVQNITVDKGFSKKGCDKATYEKEEMRFPTIGNYGAAEKQIAIYLEKPYRNNETFPYKILTSLEAYLLNDNGKTIERLN